MPTGDKHRYLKVFLLRIIMFCIYFFGGATVFMLVEKGDANYSQFNKTAIMQEIRRNVTSQYNISEDQFTDLVHKIVKTASDEPNAPWSYSNSLTYALHLLTTIAFHYEMPDTNWFEKGDSLAGYGSITPNTEEGQILTIVYALFGIPLTLLTLKAMGCHYNQVIMKIITAVETKCFKRNQVKQLEMKTIFCNVIITLIYLFLSSLTTHKSDHFTYVQSVYAWFITMTTVGFGDFIPKNAKTGWDFFDILVGLCFMSGTIDAIMYYVEKKENKKLSQQSRFNCFPCCKSKSLDTEAENSTNQNAMELKEQNSMHHIDVQTQTIGISNYFAQYDH